MTHKKPIAWTIAGIDPSGYAGIHADLETFNHLDVNAYSITMPADSLAKQLSHLQTTAFPQAVKIGMLGKPHEALINFLQDYSGTVVLDPVLASSAGLSLIFTTLRTHREFLIRLLPLTDLITPNRIEAEKLLNCSLNSYQAIADAAKKFLDLGARSVLIKGGHFNDKLFSQDYWSNGVDSCWLASPRYPEKNYRGTGCVLSSAITACLALGYCLKDALVIAKMYLSRGIRLAKAIDQYTAKLYHGDWPENQEDLPYLSSQPLSAFPQAFKRYKPGLYPVVDQSHWFETLLPVGIKSIQLRIKNASPTQLAEEIKQSITIAKRYQATVFINDYWKLALQLKAPAVHLGQEDLATADIEALHRAGLLLGVSTHCYYEVARAHAIHPSYLACGPIYPTTSKIMPFAPQGIEQLCRWRRTLQYPLVAIGGINLQRLPAIMQTQVDGIALISAITKANDPQAVTRQLLNKMDEFSYV